MARITERDVQTQRWDIHTIAGAGCPVHCPLCRDVLTVTGRSLEEPPLWV